MAFGSERKSIVSGPSMRDDPMFHLQGGAVLGAVLGLIAGASAPRMVALMLMGAAALAFAFWFKGSLWPLLSKSRFYESFFGIQGPAPIVYVREGMAAGVIAGGAVGLLLHGSIFASLLVWAGLALVMIRYVDSARCLLSALQGLGGRRSSPYRQLLARVHGDKALAKRLIAYEARLAPLEGHDALAGRALDRLDRDSR